MLTLSPRYLYLILHLCIIINYIHSKEYTATVSFTADCDGDLYIQWSSITNNNYTSWFSIGAQLGGIRNFTFEDSNIGPDSTINEFSFGSYGEGSSVSHTLSINSVTIMGGDIADHTFAKTYGQTFSSSENGCYVFRVDLTDDLVRSSPHDPCSYQFDNDTPMPTSEPSIQPSNVPSMQPSLIPSINPSSIPSVSPTITTETRQTTQTAFFTTIPSGEHALHTLDTLNILNTTRDDAAGDKDWSDSSDSSFDDEMLLISIIVCVIVACMTLLVGIIIYKNMKQKYKNNSNVKKDVESINDASKTVSNNHNNNNKKKNNKNKNNNRNKNNNNNNYNNKYKLQLPQKKKTNMNMSMKYGEKGLGKPTLNTTMQTRSPSISRSSVSNNTDINDNNYNNYNNHVPNENNNTGELHVHVAMDIHASTEGQVHEDDIKVERDADILNGDVDVDIDIDDDDADEDTDEMFNDDNYDNEDNDNDNDDNDDDDDDDNLFGLRQHTNSSRRGIVKSNYGSKFKDTHILKNGETRTRVNKIRKTRTGPASSTAGARDVNGNVNVNVNVANVNGINANTNNMDGET